MSVTIPTQIEKCKGAMLGTAIGDALGWPNEPRSKNRAKNPKINGYFVEWTRSCSNPRYHDEKILPGEYSDDTQMTLSVARSIIAGNWEKFLAEKELPFWLKYERGGGGALLKAAKSYEKGVLPWRSNYTRDYFNAGGNGAAMRILPHVISAAKTPNITTLMIDIVKDTHITHGHPRAILGATCYAYALDYLLRKETVLEYGELVSAVIDGQQDWGAFLNPDLFGSWLDFAGQHRDFEYAREWETVCTNMMRQLDFIKTSLKKGLVLDDKSVLTRLECFSKANGAGDVAALSSIYLASRYANNPSLGVKVPAFSFGTDTDTISSITGGLLGMLSGTNWVPTEWKVVQDYDCLIQITELLLSDNKKEAAKAEVAEAKAQSSGWRSSPIGRMRLVDTKNTPNGKNGIVIIRKLQTMLGQTIYMKEAQLFENKPQYRQAEDQTQLHMQPTVAEAKPSQTKMRQVPTFVPSQKQTISEERQRQFILTTSIISDLLEKPEFKHNITAGKVFKVIKTLIETNNASAAIASQFGLDEAMIDLIKMYVK